MMPPPASPLNITQRTAWKCLGSLRQGCPAWDAQSAGPPEAIAAAACEINLGSGTGYWTSRFSYMRTQVRVPMNDDEIYSKTQSSTQWDGFRH